MSDFVYTTRFATSVGILRVPRSRLIPSRAGKGAMYDPAERTVYSANEMFDTLQEAMIDCINQRAVSIRVHLREIERLNLPVKVKENSRDNKSDR